MGHREPDPRLKLIGITELGPGGPDALIRAAEQAFAGGLPALMFREKSLPENDALKLAIKLSDLARGAGALFIVNRRLDLAKDLRADGIHLGADGYTIEEARAALGHNSILGYSAHSETEALDALNRGADYVFFSPVFETPSKAGILEPVGLKRIEKLARQAPGRVIALGGISAENIAQIARAGAAGAAVIRAIFAAPSSGDAVRNLLIEWEKGRAG